MKTRTEVNAKEGGKGSYINGKRSIILPTRQINLLGKTAIGVSAVGRKPATAGKSRKLPLEDVGL